MHPTITTAGQGDQGLSSALTRVVHSINQAAHLLPAQGPIRTFIHHNTLHAFEDLPFEEAVKKGARIFGCHPYLPEERYREALARGRIREADVQAVLREDLGKQVDAPILHLGTRFGLRRAMLLYPLRLAQPAELRWFVSQMDSLKRFRDQAPPLVRETFVEETRQWVLRHLGGEQESLDSRTDRREHRIPKAGAELIDGFGRASISRWTDSAWESFTLQMLWRICRDGVRRVIRASSEQPHALRPRDVLLAATGQDSDALVHDVLIRFCGAFLDQGLAQWPMPQRKEGFYFAFCNLYGQRGGPPDAWLRGLRSELKRLDYARKGPAESILESLQLLGIAEDDWDGFFAATLLALRGWAGMIHQMEIRGDRVAQPAPVGSLVEFVAVRLILERLALTYVAREALGFRESLHRLREFACTRLPRQPLRVDQRAFLVFHLAQLLGWLPGELYRMTKQQWATLLEEIDAFSGVERRRVYQLAYERRHRIETLDAVAVHSQYRPNSAFRPRCQLIFCIDEREESFRRHLEELAPDVETFGAAGFFGVAMYYRGAAEAHFTPLCPVVIRPQHWAEEVVAFDLHESHKRRAKARRFVGMLWHRFHVGSLTFARGFFLTAILGALLSVPLVASVLMPRWTSWLFRRAARFIHPPATTHLQLERTQPTTGTKPGQIGFTLEEMAAIVERLLRDIGLTSGFARLILVIGHGSVSLNNPHESAHDCGACGGAIGGPNARAVAQMANDLRVRGLLRQRGFHLPTETVFVGAMHNTCDERLAYYDLDRLPGSHLREFEEINQLMEQVRERNAHERCRRFESAPLDLSFVAARRHVEGRSQDLAETRPEYGHATNAVCLVGRRLRTRGLFMDRRAFLVSYDPTQDDDANQILTRILQAAVPVCAGINLEYYFSFVDAVGWGCGTKLPHNITALLGVMDGASSDLRTGLPWQMVEIHEPVRLLFVIETTPQRILEAFVRQPHIAKIFRNEWAQLAILGLNSSEIHLFRHDRFELYKPEADELPHVHSSLDWYSDKRAHLGYAQVNCRPALPATERSNHA